MLRMSVETDPDALEDLYRFRYSVYVEEMNRPQKYADPAARRIRDPLDETAHNIVARNKAGAVAGCVRVNLCARGVDPYYEDFMRMKDVGADHPARTSFCTRLMVAPAYRRSSLATRLAQEAFKLGRANNVRWSFVDCNDPLQTFFERFGCILIHRAVHEEYGEVSILRHDITDIAHMTRIGSVFLRCLERESAEAMPA